MTDPAEARTRLVDAGVVAMRTLAMSGEWEPNYDDLAVVALDAILADRALLLAALGAERVYTMQSIEGGLASVPADQHVFVFPEIRAALP